MGLMRRPGDLGGDVDEELGLPVLAERGGQHVELFGGEAPAVVERAAAGIGNGAKQEACGPAVGAVTKGMKRVA